MSQDAALASPKPRQQMLVALSRDAASELDGG